MRGSYLNPLICSSSPDDSDDNGDETPTNDNAHVWNDDTAPVTCAECGTEKEI